MAANLKGFGDRAGPSQKQQQQQLHHEGGASTSSDALPLQSRTAGYKNPTTGRIETHPALSKIWVTDLGILPYMAYDESNADYRTEYLAAIRQGLSLLLRLPYHRFWSQMVYDDSVRAFLDSYFAYCPRDFREIRAEYMEQERTIQEQVFRVMVRLCAVRESPQDFMQPSAYGDLVYNNWLLDIPRLMELCSLYGDANRELVTKMVSSVFTHQPKYTHDLEEMVPLISDTLERIQSRCSEAKEGKRSRSPLKPDEALGMLLQLSDLGHSLASFLQCYEPAAVVFQHFGIAQVLCGAYEVAMPVLYCTAVEGSSSGEEEGTRDPKGKGKGKGRARDVSGEAEAWLAAKGNTLRLVNVLVELSYGRPLRDSDQRPLCEEFASLLRRWYELPLFLRQYDRAHGVMDVVLAAAGTYPTIIDAALIDRLMDTINQAVEGGTQKATQAQQATPALTVSAPSTAAPAPQYGYTLPESREERMLVESRVSSVQEILPDLGGGFIALCLHNMKNDAEAVVNAILTDSLPPKVQKVPRDLSLKALEVPKAAAPPKPAAATAAGRKSPAAAVPNGGKTVPIHKPGILASRQNVYDGDEFDVFSRNDANVSQMHKGKKDRGGAIGGDREARELTRWIAKDYELQPVFDEYDDEYDDTYDSVDFGGGKDVDSADELRVPNNRSLPWARGMGGAGGGKSSDVEGDDDIDDSAGVPDVDSRPHTPSGGPSQPGRGRGRGRGKGMAQDPRPAPSAEGQRAERSGKFGGSQQAGDGGDTGGGGATGGGRGRGRGRGGKEKPTEKELRDRAYNDRHKAQRANHNRKEGATRKLARGMN